MAYSCVSKNIIFKMSYPWRTNSHNWVWKKIQQLGRHLIYGNVYTQHMKTIVCFEENRLFPLYCGILDTSYCGILSSGILSVEILSCGILPQVLDFVLCDSVQDSTRSSPAVVCVCSGPSMPSAAPDTYTFLYLGARKMHRARATCVDTWAVASASIGPAN